LERRWLSAAIGTGPGLVIRQPYRAGRRSVVITVSCQSDRLANF
jgi:hypothetical protein